MNKLKLYGQLIDFDCFKSVKDIQIYNTLRAEGYKVFEVIQSEYFDIRVHDVVGIYDLKSIVSGKKFLVRRQGVKFLSQYDGLSNKEVRVALKLKTL